MSARLRDEISGRAALRDEISRRAATRRRRERRLDAIVRELLAMLDDATRQQLRFIAGQATAVALPSLYDHAFAANVQSLWRAKHGAR